jgi:hypothetical protein
MLAECGWGHKFQIWNSGNQEGVDVSVLSPDFLISKFAFCRMRWLSLPVQRKLAALST